MIASATDPDWYLPFAGYVIVVQEPWEPVPHDRRYRGLYRTPEWTEQKDALGFTPDLMDFEDEAGMILSLDGVMRLLDRYARFEDPASLEVLYVTPATDAPHGASGSNRLEFLGIDVTTPRPFYSLLLTKYGGAWFEAYLPFLNENGLFDDIGRARGFLDAWFEAAGGSDPDFDRADIQLSNVYLSLDEQGIPLGRGSAR